MSQVATYCVEPTLYATVKPVQPPPAEGARRAAPTSNSVYGPCALSEPGPFVVVGANVSPDGNHVLVNRENFLGQCGGNIPTDSVELVTVATQSHVDIPNIWETGWLNNSEFLVVDAKGVNWVYNLEGKLVQKLTPANWLYLGTISSPGSSDPQGS